LEKYHSQSFHQHTQVSAKTPVASYPVIVATSSFQFTAQYLAQQLYLPIPEKKVKHFKRHVCKS
jgi:hypothetical protein